MSDRKAEILIELASTIARMAELAIEAKALGLTDDELDATVGPVLERFGEAFDGGYEWSP